MMDRNQLLEQLDAMRPGDLERVGPAGAELRAALAADPSLERKQQWLAEQDAAIQRAMTAAPTPEGLESRLLAALDRADSAVADELSEASDEEQQVERAATSGSRHHRRGWLRAAVLSAAAALVVGLGLWWNPVPRLITPGEVPAAAIQYHLSADASAPLVGMETPPELAFAPQLNRSLAIGWREAENLLGAPSPGVAFALRGHDGQPATLYTVRGRVEGLPPMLDTAHSIRTAGVWAAAWQAHDQVFVLVIPTQNPESYRQFLPAAGRLAMLVR